MNLAFPDYNFQIKTEKNKNYIFDPIRRKYVWLSPEEWVRQHVIQHFIQLNYPKGRISVEKQLPNSSKRYDAIVFDENIRPLILVECKSPNINIDQNVIDQSTFYLQKLDAPFILLTNGLTHFWIERNTSGLKVSKEIPEFSKISG